MKKILPFLLSVACFAGSALAAPVKTSAGMIEGTVDSKTGIRMYKGVPFAEPPVGNLRWREPQPVQPWQGVRQATQFGPRCMQRAIYSDMIFRSNGMSEDCLYLNIWAPAATEGASLPVLVYIFGGGFTAGDGSEPRYDGESMARKGIVAITINYRLNVFGMLSHADLTKQSPHHTSGNYTLLDQAAALRWVHDNIAGFGGDPAKITVAGESAGSMSVSAQVASPLSKGLLAGAIGESGSYLATSGLAVIPLAQAEQTGAKFVEFAGADSLAALRAMPADQLLAVTAKPGGPRLMATVDGYFFPKRPADIYDSGEQAHIPLLAGWNAAEAGPAAVLRREQPTVENLSKAIRNLYPDRGDEVLKVYTAATPAEVTQVATDLASDRFIAFGTWKWTDAQSRTSGKPVYRYFFSRVRPGAAGASHASEIEYALGNLAGNKTFAWTADDYNVSATMQDYFANFVKTGNPNGKGLPEWPPVEPGKPAQVMRIDVDSHATQELHRDRYQLLNELDAKH